MSKLTEVLSRPATIILTSRVDARYLATLARFWTDKGNQLRSTSELVRLSVEAFAELLVVNNSAEFIQTQADAQEILERMGLDIKATNPRNMAKALQSEDFSLDSLTTTVRPDAGHQRTTKARPAGAGGSPIHSQALANLERVIADDLATRITDAQGRTEDFKSHMGITPKSSTEGGERK